MQSKINSFFKPKTQLPFPPPTPKPPSEITITYNRRPRNPTSESIVGSVCDSVKEDALVFEKALCRFMGKLISSRIQRKLENTTPSSPKCLTFSISEMIVGSICETTKEDCLVLEKSQSSESVVGSICESAKEDGLVLEKALCSSSGNVLNKKRSYAQLHLELGQSDFLLRSCKICGFKYAPGDELDEKTHKKFHRNYTQGLPFKGWKNEKKVQMPLHDGQHIVLVVEDDPPAWRNKVKEMVKMMEMEIGDDWILHEQCKVYLFVSSQRIAGCLVSEPIERAYRIVTSSCTKSHSSNQNQTKPKPTVLKFGGVSFSREVARTDTGKSCALPEENESGIILSEKEAVPALCGIRAIWVTPSNRRKHIASHLLDATRKTFCDSLELERWQLAFSQPTKAGKALISNFTGTGSFLVYTTTGYK